METEREEWRATFFAFCKFTLFFSFFPFLSSLPHFHFFFIYLFLQEKWSQLTKRGTYSLQVKKVVVTHLLMNYFNFFRVKYFRLVLSVKDESEDMEDKWTPVIDMKSFREACFHGNFFNFLS